MAYFKPTRYYKDVYSIDYKKLVQDGIKCIVFDLDNTLGKIDNLECPDKTKKLLKELQKDFTIFISSNNTRKRIEPYLKELGVEGVAWSLKPSTRGLRKVRSYGFKKEEMVIIGDQIVTDILAGRRFKIKTILVDPLGKADLKITGLNRKIENFIVKRYMKKGIFERGKYYE